MSIRSFKSTAFSPISPNRVRFSGYQYRAFPVDQDVELPPPPREFVLARILIVGGGASGRMGWLVAANGGGGSGGQVIELSSQQLFTDPEYSLFVGAKGIGSSSTTPGEGGQDGGNSSFESTIALGGGTGGGQVPYSQPHQGAYGGGAGRTTTSGVQLGASGLVAFKGGDNQNVSPFRGGGGGGAGGVGNPGTTNGNGGPGVQSDISGSALFYGAGGGGGADSSPGQGGSGIGGNGGCELPPTISTDASPANRGAGGGGGSSAGVGGSTDGSDGSDGVVIVSYPGDQKFSGGTVTTAGSNTVHTFTAVGLQFISPL